MQRRAIVADPAEIEVAAQLSARAFVFEIEIGHAREIRFLDFERSGVMAAMFA